MSELITVFNQENLIAISKMQYRRVKQRMESNSFMHIAKSDYLSGDRKCRVVRSGTRYLLVDHYDAVKPEGGLSIAYKVDKEIWAEFARRFPDEVADRVSAKVA